MLLVNNSLRCRLRSLCPSHRSQSEALAHRALIGGNVRKTLSVMQMILLHLKLSVFAFQSVFPILSAVSESVRKTRKFYSFNILHFSSRHICFPPSFCYLQLLSSPSPCLFLFVFSVSFTPSISWSFRRQGEVKNIGVIQTSTCWKGNKSWSEVLGANTRKPTSEQRIEVQVEGQN